MPVLAGTPTPPPDPVDLALADALHRYLNSKAAPKYLRTAAAAWLAKRAA